MSYLQSNLLKDEKIIIEGRLSKRFFYIQLIMAFVVLIIYLVTKETSSVGTQGFLIVFFLVFLFFFIKNLIKYNTTEIILTNKRFVRKTGVLSRNLVELKHEKIEGVSLEQGLLGKMLNYGALSVTGTGNTLYYTRWLNAPLTIKEKLYKHIK